MFGFRKRKTAYEGLLQISITLAHTLHDDELLPHGAISLSAYTACWLTETSREYGLNQQQLASLERHMRSGAEDVFAPYSVTPTLWLRSYETAKTVLTQPLSKSPLPSTELKFRFGWLPIFYDAREQIVPWDTKPEAFLEYGEAIMQLMSDLVVRESKRWKPGAPPSVSS